jgi:molybdopterin-guanine dinucleotide biosynthesis protein MobB
MAPVVSVIGQSNSGKTALIEKLVQELKLHGFRVATIKRTPQRASFDEPDNDSWRYIKAGSEATVVSSPDETVMIKHVTQRSTLDETARILGEDYNIILTEGFKQGSAPKIEIHRKGAPFLQDIKKLIAIVTDEPLDTKVRQFSPEDIKDLADFLKKGFIKPQKERISLYVNNTPIPLTAFPRQIISTVLLAMASCLKGGGEIKSLQFFFKKGEA